MGFWRREKARIHVKNRFMMSRDDTRAWNGFLMKRSVRNTEAAHSDIGERTIGRRTWGRSDRGSLREEFGMLMSSPSLPWGPGPSPPGSPLRVLSLPGTGNVGILTVANYRTHDQLSSFWSTTSMSLQLATRYSVRGKRLLRYVRSSIREKKLIFRQIREERQAEAAVALLAHIIQVLTPLPFFRTSLIGLVKKLISPTEPYSDLVSSSINFSDSSCALL
jgi:hypothetical protein